LHLINLHLQHPCKGLWLAFPNIPAFRQRKTKKRRNKALIVDASREFKAGRAQNELLPEHAERIHGWYRDFKEVAGVARVVTLFPPRIRNIV